MANDDPRMVALLKVYQTSRVVTRPEVGVMTGKTVGFIAGICHRNNIPWPEVPPEIKPLRSCCFLVTDSRAIKPKLCCNPVCEESTFLCSDHIGKTWDPS